MSEPFMQLIEHQAVGLGREQSLTKGDFLFRQQQPATAIFVVVSGRIRLFRDLADGSSVTLHIARSAETFAEAALFADHYHCHAQAELDSVVTRIHSQQLRESMLSDPALAMRLSRILATQVRDMRAMLSLRDIRSADERVLAWLRLKAKGEHMLVTVDRSWSGIAEELGLTREAVYRALAHLQRKELIVREGRQDVTQSETVRVVSMIARPGK